MGELRYSSTILDIGRRWRWVVSFSLRLFTPGKELPVPILWESIWVSKSRSARCGVEENLLPLSVSRLHSVDDRTINENVAVYGMKIDRISQKTRRKPVPAVLRPPQIPHNLTWFRILPAVEGSRRLIAWAYRICSVWLRPNKSDFYSLFLKSFFLYIYIYIYIYIYKCRHLAQFSKHK
jgi:hypothetical protein